MKNQNENDNDDSEIVQLNARVPKKIRRVHKSVAAAVDVKMEELAADALRVFYGVASREVMKRQADCAMLYRAMNKGQSVPFDSDPIRQAALA